MVGLRVSQRMRPVKVRMSQLLAPARNGQPDRKRAPVTHFALDRDVPAVPCDKLLGDREAQTGAGRAALMGRFTSVEPLEQPRLIFG